MAKTADASNDLEARYKKLKKQVDQLQFEMSHTQGQLDNMLYELEQGFGCSTIEDAEILLEQLTKKEAKQRKMLSSALAKFEERWRDKLQSTT